MDSSINSHSRYETPLVTRYASPEMVALFGERFKILTWRRLWIALAKAQRELGLPIQEAQILEMEANAHQIDFEKAAAFEKRFRHDVMAHIHTFGELCPQARSIIHLGATSAFVTDNADLLAQWEGLHLLFRKLKSVLRQLAAFAQEHASLACLSYTHFQPAQPTTVGRRACLWLQDLLMDLDGFEELFRRFRLLGLKGATGTQASLLTLFHGDGEKVKECETALFKHLGFDRFFPISSQTYPRKQDAWVVGVLALLATSCHKMGVDLRLLAHMGEVEEPHAKEQIGSSAMPHKQNPILAERLCSLSRLLLSTGENLSGTAAQQWLERSLDDSAIRRIALPEAFLTADSLLNLLLSITKDLRVYPKLIALHLDKERPFLALENLLMAAVEKGGDRQKVHAQLRRHALAESQRRKEGEPQGDLFHELANDPEIPLNLIEIHELAAVDRLIGRSKEQTEEFLALEVTPRLSPIDELAPLFAIER